MTPRSYADLLAILDATPIWQPPAKDQPAAAAAGATTAAAGTDLDYFTERQIADCAADRRAWARPKTGRSKPTRPILRRTVRFGGVARLKYERPCRTVRRSRQALRAAVGRRRCAGHVPESSKSAGRSGCWRPAGVAVRRNQAGARLLAGPGRSRPRPAGRRARQCAARPCTTTATSNASPTRGTADTCCRSRAAPPVVRLRSARRPARPGQGR